MRRYGTTLRLVRAVAFAITLTVGAAACQSSGGGSDSGAAKPSGTPTGSTTVSGNHVDLSIKDAVVHRLASGGARLDMTVHNGSGVPEHLGDVIVPGGGRGTLHGGSGADGSKSTAGILLTRGSSTVFSSRPPSVTLPSVHGMLPGHVLPVTFQFGVAGMVRLRVPVSGG